MNNVGIDLCLIFIFLLFFIMYLLQKLNLHKEILVRCPKCMTFLQNFFKNSQKIINCIIADTNFLILKSSKEHCKVTLPKFLEFSVRSFENQNLEVFRTRNVFCHSAKVLYISSCLIEQFFNLQNYHKTFENTFYERNFLRSSKLIYFEQKKIC